jgi:hypothetical protein
MDSTGSFLKTVLERVRGYLDDSDFDAKYQDQFVVQHVIMPALVDVWSRVSLNADNPVFLSYDITLVERQECYVLPSCVGEVHELVQYDTTTDGGSPITEIVPKHRMSVGGPNWSLEGNMICFRPFPMNVSATTPYTVRYTSNGDMSPHYNTDVSTTGTTAGYVGTDRTTFVLSSAPTLGLLDKRENCYAGQILRILDGSVFEERVIASYEPTTRTCTMKRAFSSNVTVAKHVYEVAPAQSQGLIEAVAIACALKLGTWRKCSQAQMGMFTQQYRSAIKTIGDNLANMQLRTGKSWAKDTRDNPNWRP